MVSIHNTHEFHNYITTIPPKVVETNPNTILSYIETNYPDIYSSIKSNHLLHNKLNNPLFKYTLFLPISNFNIDELINYLYKGELIIQEGQQHIVVSEGGVMLSVMNNQVNGENISISNNMMGNGIVHIL